MADITSQAPEPKMGVCGKCHQKARYVNGMRSGYWVHDSTGLILDDAPERHDVNTHIERQWKADPEPEPTVKQCGWCAGLGHTTDEHNAARPNDPRPRKSERRTPYVGEGSDGARRSAEIDRTEAETYPTGSEDAERCLASAERWMQQARDLVGEEHVARIEGMDETALWNQVTYDIRHLDGGAIYQTARRVRELASVKELLRRTRAEGYLEAQMNWSTE